MLITKLLKFVFVTSLKHSIDESHGLTHSMNVLNHAHNIYKNELYKYPPIQEYERIIYTSAIVHDMCDKKYMNQDEGIKEIEYFLQDKLTYEELDVTKQIISTMSYSTVKKNGFPSLGIYQHAYHIVREADLLSAYDFDRCMIYNMNKKQSNFEEAFADSYNLFQNRVLQHNKDGLLLTDYSIRKSQILENKALSRIENWRKILKITTL
jgi:HD superfamily phosphodiesterase